MKTLFTFILVLFMCAELHSQWTLQNKLTYQQDLTSVYFTDQNTGYAVADMGFLFATNDEGNTWNLNSSLYKGKLNSIFITGNVGYTAGDKGTIIKIVNGSLADKQESNVTVNLNSIYFTSSGTGYCCGNSGTILKTTNSGATWTKLTTGTDYSLSSIYFTDSNTGYAVGGQNTTYMGIILKTTNAGSTWQVKYSGQANRYLYSVHFENSTTGWACGWNGTVLKTTNGGTNWVLQTSGVTSHLKSLCFKSLQEGIAVGAGGTVIVTTNGGTNWVKMQSGTTEQLNSVYIPGDNTAAAVGNRGVIIRNNNGGTSWVQKSINNYSSLGKIYFVTKDIGWINAGGSLYKTTNGGQTWLWKKTIDSIYITDFSFPNTQVGYAISWGEILKTTDGGENWEVIYNHYDENASQYEREYLTSVYFTDNDYGWSTVLGDEYNKTKIISTTNGGKSWQIISEFGYTSYLHKVCFQNRNIGYLIGYDYYWDIADNAIVYKTTDGGKTWGCVFFFYNGYYENSKLVDINFTGNNIFIIGDYEDMYDDVHQFSPGAIISRSTDGGLNWATKEYDLPSIKYINGYEGKINSICMPTSSVGYVVGGDIIKTTDGGSSWFLQNSPVNDILNSVCFTDADNGYAVGDNGVILKHQKETVTAQINWAAKLNFFTKDHNQNDVLKDSLTFGQNSSATNGLDKSFGETELPPVPPGGTFDARFILPDDPSISTDKDIRSIIGTNISWNINVQYKDFPLKVSWGNGGGVNLIPGEFYLNVNGSYINVNMKDTTQVIIDSPPNDNSITLVYHSPEYNITEGIMISYSQGWSLISIPLKNSKMTRTGLFSRNLGWPVISGLFEFSDKYFVAENLVNGRGYWASINSNGPISGGYMLPFSGVQVYHPVNVKKGWNIIGPFDKDVPISKISTQPANILTTPFYGFDIGYFSASTLNPGKGYWVKSNSDGVVNFNVTGLSKEIEPLAANQSNLGKITITDNSGSSTTLYDVIGKDVNLQQYEMPPLPPSGIFDARYNSGLLAERLDADGKAIVLNSASYPVTIKADGIDLRLGYSVNGIRTETVLQNGSSYTIKESSVRVIEVKKTADRIIPKQFSLHQNYPNPFNPKTKIKYDLPEKSKVNLSVYNILGERIAELVNGEMEAGYHEVEFNANSIASGVYIYRIDTDKEHSVKKMLLLK